MGSRMRPDVDLAARKWLERLNGQYALDAVQEFESVARTETFCADWSKQSAELESRLQELDSREVELRQAMSIRCGTTYCSRHCARRRLGCKRSLRISGLT
jgi:hypothetical protein